MGYKDTGRKPTKITLSSLYGKTGGSTMTDRAKKLAILYKKINQLPVLSAEEVEIIKDLIGRELFKEIPK